jgi:hypothetical protein
MSYTMKHLSAAVEGAHVSPVRSIPYRLDASAIHKNLLGLGIELPENWRSIVASGQTLSIKQIDAALDKAGITSLPQMRNSRIWRYQTWLQRT